MIDIFFVSSLCSKKKYKKIFYTRKEPIITPSQKFFQLIIDGMHSTEKVKITCMTALPVSSNTFSEKEVKYEKEIIDDRLEFNYLGFKNGKITRHLSLILNSSLFFYKWLNENKNRKVIVLTDCLCWQITIPVQILCYLYKIRKVSFVTDLPRFSDVKSKYGFIRRHISSWVNSLTELFLKYYDGYIFLTSFMREEINKNDAPYIIVESSVDGGTLCEAKPFQTTKYIFMYAGAVCERYGIVDFAEVFEKCANKNMELWIFGNGDAVDLINQKNFKSVIYKGCVSLQEIVEFEKKATVLINPRPTTDLYTRFSFPSKTCEYMISGTPVLSTRLSGIPHEYNSYIFWFSDCSKIGYQKGIASVMKMTHKELYDFGRKAQKFCFVNKNNIKQGTRIVDFISEIR